MFAVTIFLSAFLLFQVQPMMGRYILPWFGGTPSVWSICLLFFQAALLCGYAYAHAIGSWKHGRFVHMGALAVSLALLPIIPDTATWKPEDADNPSGRILLLLTAVIGGPYFLLSATAPLLQRWYKGDSPYRLYALSNAGSLLALLSYPIVFEPVLRLRTQGWMWSGAYAAFALLCAANAWNVRTAPKPAHEEAPHPAPMTILYWLGLAATGTALLIGTTNLVTQDIAVSPFLWIAPLAIYLLTFILAFEHDRWYNRPLFAILTGVLASTGIAMMAASIAIDLWLQLAGYLTALFTACMVCHGELGRARPAARHLTLFYLTIAAGGVIGGVFVALLAPRLFTEFTEYPIAMAAACALGLIGWFRDGAYQEWAAGSIRVRIPLMALLFGAVIAAYAAFTIAKPGYQEVARDFYGILRVADYDDGYGEYRQMSHGRTKHGSEFLEGPLAGLPVSYYGPTSGVALTMTVLGDEAQRIGVIGLGTGTMAGWARPGGSIRFYEIDPEVERMARQWFTFLPQSRATVEVVHGDARVQMERELAEGRRNDYDLIVLDAFSSDAIPIHLLTAESADLYKQRLAPNGKMLVHISNRALDLEPVVRGMAQHLGFGIGNLMSSGKVETGEEYSRWLLLTADERFMQDPRIAAFLSGWSDDPPLLWSDDFASLWHVLRW